ncbi:MAG TPA: twin-arginine translocase TatA/TatE family subunit [Planctomycetota bacterium]|nr:twin-arginine translocase TatA/TatE family subunit [Planctomycetota bacterium]
MPPLAFLNQVGPLELVLILVVALLLFGGRLPEVGRSLGRSLAQFKKGLQDMREEIEREEPVPPRSRRDSTGIAGSLPPPPAPPGDGPAPPSGGGDS